MLEFLQGAGWFVYPLGLCSVVGLMIIIERGFALRISNVFPASVARSLLEDSHQSIRGNSSLERIADTVRSQGADREYVRTLIRLEVDRLQRGLFMLDVIVSIAPLLGLMGTVAGLVSVFGQVQDATGMPTADVFSEGVALALSTTLIGLAIAIPCLIAGAFFNRRIEKLANSLDAWFETWSGIKTSP
jgi:biopolymer transport protein ExbB